MRNATAGERYEIQARLLRRRDGVLMRDESRLGHADTLEQAMRTANTWVAEGFTVWIYRVEAGTGVRPVYRSVRTLTPTPPASRDGARGSGGGGSRAARRAG
ncbi:MAG: hypothetical protein ACRDRH_09725 [Pseudonocardia sp.]